jgi:Protein of unknown function (DUF3592)
MRIVLYVLWALFVATAAYLLIKHLRQTKQHERQIAGWPKVQATVTGNVAGWTNGGGNGTRNRVFYPTYQFTHPNGALYAGESEVSYRNQREPGSFLNVAYNPANPNQSFEVSAESKALIGCVIPTFAFFGLILFWAAGAFPLG